MMDDAMIRMIVPINRWPIEWFDEETRGQALAVHKAALAKHGRLATFFEFTMNVAV